MKRLLIPAFIAAIGIAVLPRIFTPRYKVYIDEAKSNLGAIRSCEVAYFAEWKSYVGNQPSTPVVDRTRKTGKFPWRRDTRFSVLGFEPEGSVACSYTLDAPDWPQAGFTAMAECDRDGDGLVVVYTITEKSAELVRTVHREPGLLPWLRAVWSGDEKYTQ